MPRTFLNVESSELSITRKVVQSVLPTIIGITNSPSTTRIHYPGFDDEQRLPSDLRDRLGEHEGTPRVDATVEVREHFDESALSQSVLGQPEYPPIYHDPSIGARIMPSYARTRIELGFQFRYEGMSQATAHVHEIKRRLTLHQDLQIHEAHYDYLLPQAYLALIQKIHQLKENQGGDGEYINDYLARTMTDQMTIVSNRDGSSIRLSKEEVQTNIIGQFDNIDIERDLSYADDNASIHAELRYILYYDKILGLQFDYPLVIHNQILPSDYHDRNHAPPFEMGARDRVKSRFRDASDRYTTNDLTRWPHNSIPIPFFLDWFPSRYPRALRPMIRIQLINDSPEEDELFSLKDLVDEGISERVINFLIKEDQRLLRLHESFFHLNVYENDRVISSDRVKIDDGKILFPFDPDTDEEYRRRIRCRYNAAIFLYDNIHTLTSEAVDSLLEDKAFAEELLKTIDPNFRRYENLFTKAEQHYDYPSSSAIEVLEKHFADDKTLLEAFGLRETDKDPKTLVQKTRSLRNSDQYLMFRMLKEQGASVYYIDADFAPGLKDNEYTHFAIDSNNRVYRDHIRKQKKTDDRDKIIDYFDQATRRFIPRIGPTRYDQFNFDKWLDPSKAENTEKLKRR